MRRIRVNKFGRFTSDPPSAHRNYTDVLKAVQGTDDRRGSGHGAQADGRAASSVGRSRGAQADGGAGREPVSWVAVESTSVSITADSRLSPEISGAELMVSGPQQPIGELEAENRQRDPQ